MTHERLDKAAQDAIKKHKILLQHKTLELLLQDMVSVQGLHETKHILKWWVDRLDEF